MKIKLWGVRGSLPAPHPPEIIEARLIRGLESFLANGRAGFADVREFVQTLPPEASGGYGGNTACIEVTRGQKSIIIDAGSGVRRVSEKLMAGEFAAGRGEAHLFFTHFHWDHLIGLPFFVPIFIPGNIIHLYAVQPELEQCIRALFKKPFFPVPFEALGATIKFHRLEPRKPIEVNGMMITPYQLDHPDPCWGYRVEADGKAYAHCVDTECTRVKPEDLGPDLPLYKNADLVLFDAQYTLLEAVEKMNWGHSAAPIGLEIALREGAKMILFAHHDPGASDEKIADAARQTREYMESHRAKMSGTVSSLMNLNWAFAREGQVIEI
jgi:phosphoribosyl 1,2-cyclic phosphodiesterase